jgi:hypothetical protein
MKTKLQPDQTTKSFHYVDSMIFLTAPCYTIAKTFGEPLSKIEVCSQA